MCVSPRAIDQLVLWTAFRLWLAVCVERWLRFEDAVAPIFNGTVSFDVDEHVSESSTLVSESLCDSSVSSSHTWGGFTVRHIGPGSQRT